MARTPKEFKVPNADIAKLIMELDRFFRLIRSDIEAAEGRLTALETRMTDAEDRITALEP